MKFGTHDWLVQQRMKTRGHEMIATEDSCGHYSWDEWCGTSTSAYGDPEQALIEEQTPSPPTPTDLFRKRALRELRAMCSCLLPTDRVMLVARANGCTQEEVAKMVGLETQVGICNREKRLRAWVRYSLERRMILHGLEEPKKWERHPMRRATWHGILWGHETTVEVAERLRVNQSTVHGWWKQAIRDVLATATPEVARAVRTIAERIELWQRPRRSPRRKPKRRTTTKMPDPDLALMIYAIDLACALWKLEHPDYCPKIDPRTRKSGLGIDLSRAEVVEEVRRLFWKFGVPRCLKVGLEPEDVLCEVLKDVEVRNQGRCPFDPVKGAFSTYVVRIIGQSVGRCIQKELRRRPPTVQSLESMDVEMDRIVVDDGGQWTEAEYEDAERHVLGTIVKHAGRAGRKYAEARMSRISLDSALTHGERKKVLKKRQAILADLEA